MRKIFILIFCTLLLPASLFAQETVPSNPEPIDTERPGWGNSSKIMPKGYYQFELGFWHLQDKTSNLEIQEIHYPEVIIRAGILSFLEFQAGFRNTRTRVKVSDPQQQESSFTEKGINDVAVGTKLRLCSNSGLRPEAAFESYFRLPVGKRFFNGTKVEPKLRLNFRNELSDKFTLHYNLALNWRENNDPAEDQQFNHHGLVTMALQYMVSRKVQVYFEAYTQKEKRDFLHSIDSGFTFMAKENLQFDAYVGYGLSEEAPDFYASTGISIRLPK